MFEPRYDITPAIATSLMEIEASRQAVLELPIDVEMLASLRHTARLAATHYSTQIEGNRLTLSQVEETLAGAHFPGRERDETEVRHYWKALDYVDKLAPKTAPITEDNVRRIQGIVLTGRTRPLPYRDGQNVIRDARSGRIVYLPPEATDVPSLMSGLVEWINVELDANEIPPPITAALTHYQYATIHPYYDGNGRTARLITTLLLHRSGYGMKGIYSLEEHYAHHLDAYYSALDVGRSHNYYLGRADADVTPFVEFFCRSMADALSTLRFQARRAAERGASDSSGILRGLDPRQRRVLELFHGQAVATSSEIASHLGLSVRATNQLCRKWIAEGFLIVDDPSRKARSYRLGQPYEELAVRAGR